MKRKLESERGFTINVFLSALVSTRLDYFPPIIDASERSNCSPGGISGRQQRKKRRNHFPLTPAQFGVLVRGFLFYIYSKPYLARSKLRRAGSFSLSRMIMKLKTPYLIRYPKSAKRICYKLECRKIEKKTVNYSYHMITIPVMVHETLQYQKNSSRKPRNAIQSNQRKKLTDPNQYAK